jgi:hypothetical protein
MQKCYQIPGNTRNVRKKQFSANKHVETNALRNMDPYKQEKIDRANGCWTKILEDIRI